MTGFALPEMSSAEPATFVEFWRGLYTSTDEVYLRHLKDGHKINTDDVIALMQWKAGPRHAKRAEAYGRATPINSLNARRPWTVMDDASLMELRDELEVALKDAGLQTSGSIIWLTFLCHLAQPSTTPIYDVNAWTAWGYIEGWLKSSQLAMTPVRFKTYLGYRTWFNDVTNACAVDPRDFDRALKMFGQFLRSPVGRRTVVEHDAVLSL